MATNITPVEIEVEAPVAKTFSSARIVRVKHVNGGVTDINAVVLSDEGDVQQSRAATAIGLFSGKTVQQALDDLESFLGESPDLTTLTVEDFLHSVAHQHMRDNDLYT